MPAAESALLDIREWLRVQSQERYKSFVLHSPIGKETERRAFASRLAELEGGTYIDVLAHVAASPELAKHIDILDVELLRQLAVDAASDNIPLVVIDEFDFLLPVWGNDLTGLQQLITTLSRTDTPAVVVFAMQTQPTIEKWVLSNSHGQSRIIALSSIQSLS